MPCKEDVGGSSPSSPINLRGVDLRKAAADLRRAEKEIERKRQLWEMFREYASISQPYVFGVGLLGGSLGLRDMHGNQRFRYRLELTGKVDPALLEKPPQEGHPIFFEGGVADKYDDYTRLVLEQ